MKYNDVNYFPVWIDELTILMTVSIFPDILEVPQEKLSSAGLLAAEVKGRVSTLQEHVIWLET